MKAFALTNKESQKFVDLTPIDLEVRGLDVKSSCECVQLFILVLQNYIRLGSLAIQFHGNLHNCCVV